jgi:predicted adenylyl cyclase CyaB
MKELEVKILEINKVKVQQTLKDLGARKIFDGEIKTLFFDFKDGRLYKAKSVLRLRKEIDKTELTFKKVFSTHIAKQAKEFSVEVSSIERAQQILQQLGLCLNEDMTKHRISYELGNSRFDIDRYLGVYSFIPEFLEIEADNIDIVHNNAELLGFKAKDCLPWSTEQLIQHYVSSTSSS